MFASSCWRGGGHIRKNLETGEIIHWKKSTQTESKRQKKKERIQQAFSNAANVEVIPATESKLTNDNAILRVAAYCRVSTYEEAQAGSFELQVQHYKEMIEQNPKWELAGIYADEGVSATSMHRRVQFLRMIEDCRSGKIDLIITKGVNRFARNTRDCLDVVRQLKLLHPPVGVLFETENLNTLESKNEFTLGVMSLVAQGESEQKSAAITWSIIERFKKGIPIISTHNLLGFDKDSFGQIVIVEEEANIIRYIYDSYMDGSNAREIAQSLTDARIPTIMGNPVWKGSTILRILKNEKYCGDVLMQKTFTVDCFTHQKMKNTGQRPQYLLKGGIPAIIPKARWLATQELLKERRFSKKPTKKPDVGVFVRRVKTGALQGFIYINPSWSKKEIAQVLEKLLQKR
ncbi:recombinase family protein [Agathobaculum sp.]|uniref:recombinase family protein n=1 Tax=Agathobaculum sp. TaxID=2048138 RepID=UPI002A80C2F3|nr:recombinase family protein [Agathobaculum sp.]MDY3618765.1 recombinase family protein [Agathobaculum sp.]